MNQRNGATHSLVPNTAARVWLCRSCCCGTVRKHPETDHQGQVAALSAVARTRVVDCLGECAHSNVVVVRGGDGSSVWLGGVNDAALTDAVCVWLAEGAAQPPPPILESKVFIRRPSNVEPRSSAVELQPSNVELQSSAVEPRSSAVEVRSSAVELRSSAVEVRSSAVGVRRSVAVGADAEDVEPVGAGLEAAGVQRLVERRLEAALVRRGHEEVVDRAALGADGVVVAAEYVPRRTRSESGHRSRPHAAQCPRSPSRPCCDTASFESGGAGARASREWSPAARRAPTVRLVLVDPWCIAAQLDSGEPTPVRESRRVAGPSAHPTETACTSSTPSTVALIPNERPDRHQSRRPMLAPVSGGRGIRTPGAARPAGFQDQCNRPLCHPSS